jgi:hypothetical protein
MMAKYRLMSSYRPRVKEDLYWIERKFFLGPWITVPDTMSFEKDVVENIFSALENGDLSILERDRVIKEISV